MPGLMHSKIALDVKHLSPIAQQKTKKQRLK